MLSNKTNHSIVPYIRELPLKTPFKGVSEMERDLGDRFVARLGANESPWGISDYAKEAIVNSIPGTCFYPDPISWDLRTELANKHQVDKDNILIGSGIDGILAVLAHVFIQPKTFAITTDGTYPTFEYFVLGRGGRIIKIPYTEDFHANLDQMLETLKSQSAKLIYLPNPDNPTGSLLSPETIKNFYNQLPQDCILILDEAYFDFIPTTERYPINLQEERIIRLRTFSKAHGLASLRIGYAIADKAIINNINKVRIQFGVNAIAQQAALASLRDTNFISTIIKENEKGKAHYNQIANQLNLQTIPSFSNFVVFRLPDHLDIDQVHKALFYKKVFVRKLGGNAFANCLRVSIGREEERNYFGEQLEAIISPAVRYS